VVEATARDRYQHPDPRVQERMEILWLKTKDETHDRIAQLANVSRSTVQRTLRIYAAKGLDGVRSFGLKGPPSARTPHRATIEEEFRKHPPHAACQIGERTGVQRKPSRVRQFLKEDLGRTCLKVGPIPVPPKKTVGEHADTQADFLKDGLGTEVGGGPRRSADGVFRGRFALRAGVVPGLGVLLRPVQVRAASGRQRYNVPGAWNAVTHELVTDVTATSVCVLLHKIAQRGRSVPITLVLDNARD
jgi:transposase